MNTMTKKALLVLALGLPLPALAVDATLHKSPTCGCCAAYADYLRENGFEVSVVSTRDMAAVRQEHGVPEKLSSCHTTVIDGYVFEGHIPIEAVNRVLAERPPIHGITVPGMPLGSPGMNGQKQGPIDVYYLTDRNYVRVYGSY